ncbi:MAG: nucleotidyltransferase [Eubacteriales bacterium]|nr:nucleotidyltransferase [Clostridiales bacterium]MDY5836887.1 nucleotidyltransferase [Eubacteriales bacterium]
MSSEPILLILAAGLGSRYGGLKQIDPLGPHGEILMEYSLYDAVQAGFKRVVFIIGDDENLFKEAIGSRMPADLEMTYCPQRLEDLPAGFSLPDGRIKPWGTAHAVLAARDVLDAPFAVINSDDYYGPQAYRLVYDYLKQDAQPGHALLVNYILEKTLSPHGYVTRAICDIDQDKSLCSLVERFRLEADGDRVRYSQDEGQTYGYVAKDAPCSMNFWGFDPSFVDQLQAGFVPFLDEAMANNPLKAEYLLPERIGSLIRLGDLQVHCKQSADQWIGVTYKEDKPHVVASIQKLIDQGRYPAKLWG